MMTRGPTRRTTIHHPERPFPLPRITLTFRAIRISRAVPNHRMHLAHDHLLEPQHGLCRASIPGEIVPARTRIEDGDLGRVWVARENVGGDEDEPKDARRGRGGRRWMVDDGCRAVRDFNGGSLRWLAPYRLCIGYLPILDAIVTAVF